MHYVSLDISSDLTEHNGLHTFRQTFLSGISRFNELRYKHAGLSLPTDAMKGKSGRQARVGFLFNVLGLRGSRHGWVML